MLLPDAYSFALRVHFLLQDARIETLGRRLQMARDEAVVRPVQVDAPPDSLRDFRLVPVLERMRGRLVHAVHDDDPVGPGDAVGFLLQLSKLPLGLKLPRLRLEWPVDVPTKFKIQTLMCKYILINF